MSSSIKPRSACPACDHHTFAALHAVWLEITPQIGSTQSYPCHAWMCTNCGRFDVFADDPRRILDDHPKPPPIHDLRDVPPYR